MKQVNQDKWRDAVKFLRGMEHSISLPHLTAGERLNLSSLHRGPFARGMTEEQANRALHTLGWRRVPMQSSNTTPVIRFPPTLSFESHWDRWVLHLPNSPDHCSYGMVIASQRVEPAFLYRFAMWDEGDFFEVLTKAEYKERLQAIEENEGSEAAAIWNADQDQVVVRDDDHRVFALRPHFEAMMALGLFFPQTTLSSWSGKELDANVAQRMYVARMKEFRDGVEESSKA